MIRKTKKIKRRFNEDRSFGNQDEMVLVTTFWLFWVIPVYSYEEIIS